MTTKPDGYVFKGWRKDYPNWGKPVESCPHYSCSVCVNDRMFGPRQEEIYQPVVLVPPELMDWVKKAKEELEDALAEGIYECPALLSELEAIEARMKDGE